MSIPRPETSWLHKNGKIYTVTDIANLNAIDTERYPVTVIYEDAKLGNLWCRPASTWHEAFVKLEGYPCEKEFDLSFIKKVLEFIKRLLYR